MKYAHHKSKVQDAIAVLKSRGGPCYRTDIAAHTGLSLARVTAIMDQIEKEAVADPSRSTIPWTLTKGKLGGIAVTPAERDQAMPQRDRSVQSQLVRHERRHYVEYQQNPGDTVRAKTWAISARQVGRDVYEAARSEISEQYLAALLGTKISIQDAVRLHRQLMDEIDRI